MRSFLLQYRFSSENRHQSAQTFFLSFLKTSKLLKTKLLQKPNHHSIPANQISIGWLMMMIHWNNITADLFFGEIEIDWSTSQKTSIQLMFRNLPCLEMMWLIVQKVQDFFLNRSYLSFQASLSKSRAIIDSKLTRCGASTLRLQPVAQHVQHSRDGDWLLWKFPFSCENVSRATPLRWSREN